MTDIFCCQNGLRFTRLVSKQLQHEIPKIQDPESKGSHVVFDVLFIDFGSLGGISWNFQIQT